MDETAGGFVSRAEAKNVIDEVLNGTPAEASAPAVAEASTAPVAADEWGTTPDAVAGQGAFMALAGPRD